MICYVIIHMSSVIRIKIQAVRISSGMEWFEGSAKFSHMLENVPNPPIPSCTPPNRHAHYTRYESNSLNFPEFGKAIRRFVSCYTGLNHCATTSAQDPMKKFHEPCAQFYIFPPNQLFVYVSGQDIRTCRLAFEPLPYLTKVLPHHYISMQCWSNLTNIFAVPYCMPLRTSRNELYNMHGVTHVTIQA